VPNAYLLGPIIYLRPLEREDARALAGWFNDPEVNRTLRSYRPMTVAAEEEFLKTVGDRPDDLVLGIVVCETDQLVGVCGLHDIDARSRHASLGLLVGDKTAWGKGFGTEAGRLLVRHAFETLNLNRVWLHVHEYNRRGLRVYEKVGFRPEGRLRQDTFRDGRYWDTIVMGLLRDEWGAVDYTSR
jgi:RimJ/RimL family protein N-acetyltransferase